MPLHINVRASSLRLVHGRKIQMIFRLGTQVIVNVELVVLVVVHDQLLLPLQVRED